MHRHVTEANERELKNHPGTRSSQHRLVGAEQTENGFIYVCSCVRRFNTLEELVEHRTKQTMEEHLTRATTTDVETDAPLDAVSTIGRLTPTVADVAARQARPDTSDGAHPRHPIKRPPPTHTSVGEAGARAKNTFAACTRRAESASTAR